MPRKQKRGRENKMKRTIRRLLTVFYILLVVSVYGGLTIGLPFLAREAVDYWWMISLGLFFGAPLSLFVVGGIGKLHDWAFGGNDD